MTKAEDEAETRFEQVLGCPGEYHTPQQAKPVYLKGFADGVTWERQRSQKLVEALTLVAAHKRADGSYNRCREACEVLAREALKAIGGED